MNSNMTSIEEIVKYQQELLNYQRNQKQIQKETIKLLNSLNNSLTLMSDRLDEFALKTNVKLDDFTSPNSNAILINNNGHVAKLNTNMNNNNANNNSITTLNPNSLIHSTNQSNSSNNKINYLLNNEIIYLTGDILTGASNSSSSTNLINKGGANKNDLFILNDLNTNLINLDQLSSSGQANKIFLINNNNIINNNDLIRPLNKIEVITIYLSYMHFLNA
jgi:hypothetical protein